jgi:hypothetical protein
MFRHFFGIIAVLPALIMGPVQRGTAGEGQKVDPGRQLIFKVKGLT